MSLAERRIRREDHQLPHRYRQPPLPQALPPTAIPPPLENQPELSSDTEELPTPEDHLPVQVTYTTGKNTFGLFRTFHSTEPPVHDPESQLNLQDLTEGHEPEETSRHHSQDQLYPYPNESAFKLGEWYWDGTQKSQSSFQKLVDIVSNPSFQPDDVRDVPWKQINAQLASSTTRDVADKTTESIEWLEEDNGGSKRRWNYLSHSISVLQILALIHSLLGTFSTVLWYLCFARSYQK